MVLHRVPYPQGNPIRSQARRPVGAAVDSSEVVHFIWESKRSRWDFQVRHSHESSTSAPQGSSTTATSLERISPSCLHLSGREFHMSAPARPVTLMAIICSEKMNECDLRHSLIGNRCESVMRLFRTNGRQFSFRNHCAKPRRWRRPKIAT